MTEVTNSHPTGPTQYPPPPPLPKPSASIGAGLFDDNEEEAVVRVLRGRRTSRYYGQDDQEPPPSEIEAWEAELGAYLQAPHVTAVSSGTAALLCALAAAGVGPGSEVIAPCYGFVAIPAVVAALGAHLVAVGLDDGLTADPADVARACTPRTAAVVAVHMRGAPAHMDALTEVASGRGIPLVEDVAQALGGSYRGRPLGTIGDLGTYSLQSRKVITSGEGGAVTTTDARLAERVFAYQDCSENWRRLRYRGRADWPAALPGLNLRYSEILAAVARVQLRRLPSIMARLHHHHAVLSERAAEAGLPLRARHDPSGAIDTHLVVRTPSDEAAHRLSDALTDTGAAAQPLYTPGTLDLHCLPGWERYAHQLQAGPGADRSLDLLSRHVQIDIDPRWTDDQCASVGEILVSASRADRRRPTC
ncbi:DegT/DnrJ/EryC1/StrS family aminotransferase [Streptomyces lunalinharesii]|uniref:DegT/DnrJ/EryC1/StrS family aminotransferase n=1 Tax=Streptomyces lunalinharesii TaxID=333384 RepID=A0ABN3SKP2_9ACTN